MPEKDQNVLKYNHGEKSIEIPLIIYADTMSLLEKKDACNSNLEKSSTTKINKHAVSRYSLFTHFSFDATKNSNNKLWKKAIIPLANEENKSYCKQKVCYICKKEIRIDDNKKEP